MTMPLLTCPTCRIAFESTLSKAMPFCCERCKRIDLGRWLDEEISLPHERDAELEAFQDDENPPKKRDS